MKIRYLFKTMMLFLLAVSAVAENQDGNAYSIITFSEKTEYLEAEISYPVFSDTALSELNKEIEDRILGGFGENDLLYGYEKFKQEALETYEELLFWSEAGLWDDATWVYELEISTSEEDIFIDDTFVSVNLLWYEYSGGAHGNYWPVTYTFDRKLARLVTASEASGFTQKEIRDICRQELQEQLKVYLESEDGNFYLKWLMDGTEPTEEYDPFSSFTYDGHILRVFFPPYAVGPYAVGLLTVEIPVNE